MIRWFFLAFAAALAAACGGGGGGDSGPPPSKIFVADSGNMAIGSSPNSNPSPGVAVVERIVAGSNTTLTSSMSDIAIDVARDRLYVANLRAITVFDNISTATGNIAPARVVSTIPGSFGSYVGLYLDQANDVLYAAANLGSSNSPIYVFNNVSSANNVAPTRTLTGTTFLIDVAADPVKNMLYVFHTNSGLEIAVYDNLAMLSALGTPDRAITIGDSFSSGGANGIFIDPANDRLYAPRSGQVLVFDTVSTKNGPISGGGAPERTINLPVLGLSNIAVDLAANRLYTVDTGGINIINNASTVDGTPPAVTRVTVPNVGAVFKAVAVKP